MALLPRGPDGLCTGDDGLQDLYLVRALIVHLVLISPGAYCNALIRWRVFLQNPPLMSFVHNVFQGLIRGSEGLEVPRGTEGPLSAQSEGHVEVAAGQGAVECEILMNHGEERTDEALVVLKEHPLALSRLVLNTDPHRG